MRSIMLTLIVLAAVGIAVGLYRDWFHVSTQTSAREDDKVAVEVEVDTKKIRSDAKAAVQQGKKLGEQVKEQVIELAGTHSEKGRVTDIRETGDSFTLRTADEKQLIMYVTADTKVSRNNAAIELKDLEEGERVTVVYQEQDGKNIARSITGGHNDQQG